MLAQDLGDRAVEAQACYSLGNTYTLLRDYPTAVEYHLRHLIIAQQLMDRIGEGRACWSLGNAHSAMANHDKALYFANKHLDISKEVRNKIKFHLIFQRAFFVVVIYLDESWLKLVASKSYHSAMGVTYMFAAI